ncbi:MAG: 23S rRNA (guanosine(2251)-2'-O)-methyltransferase RlmB [Anaerolineaceae bacterium]|nr:23S rRNA (guanosine(2251)-2'-O)-methyltransferase RlmB [Anaerolineaceae bacterium]
MREWIIGRNPVYEVLRSGRRYFFQLRIATGAEEMGRVQEIISRVRKHRLPVNYVPRQQLDSFGDKHQGVALEVSRYPYSDLSSILKVAKNKNEHPFLLILDLIQDPQNFGTLIRTAEAVGVHGVLIPPRRAVGVIPSVVHASSGASEHMLIAQVNLAQAIRTIKSADIWVIGLEGSPEARPAGEVRLDGSLALIVGSEGEGLRSLVRKSCDMLISLPMEGKIESLNAAVAGSVVLYLAKQARLG